MLLEDGYYGSPRWSWEILDCAMPMTFDTYSNCAHQCVYCFAFFQRAIGRQADDYLHHKVKAVNVERVKRMFTDPERHGGEFKDYIKNRFVLQWGGLSDGFDWYERKFRKSLELLRFFREIDYPISISTKGTWFLDDPEYVEVIKDAKHQHWKYSIITADAEAAKKLEAGTPSPDERFRALRRFADLGVGATTLRFRPYVIGVSDKTVDAMIAKAKEAGVFSVTTEFLCLERRATPNHIARYNAISEVAGFDVWRYYRRHSYSGSGLQRLNYDVKRPYIARLKELCAAADLPLYVSDAHHKESSAGTGCCGLPSVGPLSQFNRGQFSEAMQIAKTKGLVKWSDIAPFAEWLKDVAYKGSSINAGNTLTRATRHYQSMFDFMHGEWNNPTGWSSPARYFGGVLVPGQLDEAGDIVYLYNRPFVENAENVSSVAALLKAIANTTDTRTADGTDKGHVAFPVYVVAGRTPTEEIATLLDALTADKITATLVVADDVIADYETFYGAWPLLAANGTDPKEVARRDAVENGAAQAWLLPATTLLPRGARATLSGVEGANADGTPCPHGEACPCAALETVTA